MGKIKGKDVGSVAGMAAGTAIGGPIGGAIGGAAGGLLGGLFDSDDSDANQAQLDAIMAEIDALPTPEARLQAFKKLQAVANYKAQSENNINAGQAAQISEDPALRQAQLNALQMMSKASTQGLNAQDRADLNKVRNEVARDTEAKRQQVLQNFQARGQAGSGNELASALMAAQGGADRQSEESDRIAAMSQQRALEAIKGYGQMGAQARASDLAVSGRNIDAQNEFKRFDISGQREAQARNIAAMNAASNMNQVNAQNVETSNWGKEYDVDNTNDDRLANALKLKYRKSAMKTGQMQDQYNTDVANQQAENQGSANWAAGATGAVASGYKQVNEDANSKSVVAKNEAEAEKNRIAAKKIAELSK